MSKLYLVFAELGAASKSFQEEGYAGGFVVAVVPAEDIRSAIESGEAALSEDGYEVVEIDKALLYDSKEWEHDEAVMLATAQSLDENEIRYTPFTVWGH